MIFALAAALSLVIGVVLGMLGGGGAILTLPMLVYAVGVEPKTAIATSLFVVGATSIVGTSIHARAGNVRWRAGATLGVAAMAGAFAGGRIAHFIPATILLVLFGIVMVVTAVAMLRDRTEASGEPRALRVFRMLGLGVAVGVLSGLVGAGGGFLIVPALILFGGLAVRESIGTSLFVITVQSFAGFAGHVTHVSLDWTLVLVITAAAVIGSVIGASAGEVISPPRLRRAFAWLVIAMGLFMFVKQLPPAIAIAAAALTMLAVLLTHVSNRSLAANTLPQSSPKPTSPKPISPPMP